MEETKEGAIPNYILEGISLTGDGGEGLHGWAAEAGLYELGVFALAGDTP